jgi:hypothetical protein
MFEYEGDAFSLAGEDRGLTNRQPFGGKGADEEPVLEVLRSGLEVRAGRPFG